MTGTEPLRAAPECEIVCDGADLSLHSRFVQRIGRRYAAFEHFLSPDVPDKSSMAACCAHLAVQGFDLAAAWRITRALVMCRLIALDCNLKVPLSTVTRVMTDMAEAALETACQQVQEDLDALHGAPMTAKGIRAALWVVGMGKLGARELNVSSDIDLIYVYDEDGETTGVQQPKRGGISNHEYFGKLVRGISQMLAEVTEHGFVFRIDLALRPNGLSGPSAVSLDALEEYFMVQGREWERFAWLKSRVVAPSSSLSTSAKSLRGVVLPFVFRRYLDYNVFDALRKLHRQIRDHANLRSAGRPERANDIKLSRGGIREIEFTVQLLQVVRGGQFPELRTRPTLDALHRLCAAGLMAHTTMQALSDAYVFLRQVEHRLQYLDDQQTHVLTQDDADLGWLARTMKFGNTCLFLAALDIHREAVALEFDRLLGGGNECSGCTPSKQPSGENLEAMLAQLTPRFRARVALWLQHPRVLALQETSQQRLVRLVQRTGELVGNGQASEEAALRMTDWMESLLRRESYFALLVERPQVHARLLRILGAARWPARYLMKHPGVIDELAEVSLLHKPFDAEQFSSELLRRSAALESTGEDDDEAMMLLLRRAQHSEMFRILVRDIEGLATVEQVADELSALADVVVHITAQWCWTRLKNRHLQVPQFAVLAYGKLGGKELGYGSDLDIVFVYDDAHEQAAVVYGAFVRKIINWLSAQTAEGALYEIDTALRPNGSSGLLVTTMDAFAQYQTQRGSNTAWVWEHQAMTRARCILGSDHIKAQFEAVRLTVLCAHRDPVLLANEIVSMRERVRAAHRTQADKFDVKHSAGGMVDAEFAVQFLVLAYAATYPDLRDNAGNIALLERSEIDGLLPAGVGLSAASAYRSLRHAQHLARLDEQSTQLDAPHMETEKKAVLDLWSAVFPKAA